MDKASKNKLRSGKKTAATNLLMYGRDFYRRIGAMGGRSSSGSYLKGRPDLAREIGKRGGQRGKIGYKYLRSDDSYNYYIHKESGKEVYFPRKDI